MGNNNSSRSPPTDPIDTSISVSDAIFKVDNINSFGQKHASAKIQLSNDSLYIRQKHRQSLDIPLETIKRYGLDGSIFILECGRRAPLGQARYAFRCKQANRLVDCLDERITNRSKQLLEQQRRGTLVSSSSTLTNVSLVPRRQHHHRQRRRRRTQSDQGSTRRAPSSMLLSSSSSSSSSTTSSVSLVSRATIPHRNSVPNLSENYFNFDILPGREETQNNLEEGLFIARLLRPAEIPIVPELSYVEFKVESTPISIEKDDSKMEKTIEDADIQPTKETFVEPSRRRALSSLFSHHHPQQQRTRTRLTNSDNPLITSASIPESPSTPYVYIDHQKTVTLKEIANERLQQQARRIET